MKHFPYFVFIIFLSIVTLSAVAQRVPNLQNISAQRLAQQNPHINSLVGSTIDYLSAEQNCIGWTPSIFIWQVNSRATGIDTMVLKEAGEVFDTLMDGSCMSFSESLPARIISLDYFIGHTNYSGQTDTIVFYLEETDPITLNPNGNLLWSDTVFTTSSISPFNSWLSPVTITRYPNTVVPVNFFAGIKYYGAANDTCGILASAYEIFNAGSQEATFGKALRKHAGQNHWRPDTLNQDYFYDQNSNSVYDFGSMEAFPFQTCLIYPTITNYTAITGTVFRDANMNGSFDVGELPRANTIVTAGNFSASTNTNGYFTLYVDTGNYWVQPVIQGYFTVTTPPVNIAANSYSQSYVAGDFATNDISNVQDLRIDATRNIRYVPGFPGIMTITYENFGTITMNGIVKYVPDSIPGTSWINPLPSLTNADTLIWNFSNLLPGEVRNILVYDTIPASTTLGAQIHSYAEIQPSQGDSVSSDNFVSVNDSVRGSFDPNDKTPFPAGIGAQGVIFSTQKLTFLVRFQNTGTYPAHTVIVKDTLETGFDITTFNFISSSHPCNWVIHSDRSVIFTFSNIMLPDSNANEPASHGFLKYSILPDTGIAPGTELNNTAYIFFDFNEAVVTNTTLNTIWSPSNTEEISISGNKLSVFPNPFSDAVVINWNSESEEQPTKLSLFDVSGRVVREIQVTGTQTVVQHDGIESGIYFFQLETVSGKIYAVGKIIAK